MNEVSEFLNTLGQELLPEVASETFPDTMDIIESTLTAGTGGGRIKTTTTAYEGVPCKYEPVGRIERRVTSGDKVISSPSFRMTFPTHHSGERVNIDPRIHSFVVGERGNEPEKAFRILSVGDKSGVIFECIVSKEN